MSKTVFQVLEHETLRIGDRCDDVSEKAFTEPHFNALVKYNQQHGDKFFTVQHKRIKFHQYVGVIQVRDITIEVLPKAGGDDDKGKWRDLLLTMLKTCRLIKVDSISSAHLKTKSYSLLDIYFDAFLRETERLMREGLKKRYRSEEGNLKALKGKLIFNKQISKNLVHQERFYTEHKLYDRDNLFNQILLKALLVLQRLYDSGRFTSRIKRLLFDFENISEIPVTASTFTQLKFTRNSERYRYATTLAKLIILHYSPGIESGHEDVLAIMFDMNSLFEEYVFRVLRKAAIKKDLGLSVVRQNSQPFWESQPIRPDIVIKNKDGNIAVIDTKWKVLKKSTPSSEDLRQIFVYNTHLEVKLGILLYPDAGNGLHPVGAGFKHEKYQSDKCKVMFFNLILDKSKKEAELLRILEQLDLPLPS